MAVNDDGEETLPGPSKPVEALSTGRSRRATAGNRMRELLEQERERMLAEGDEDEEKAKKKKKQKEEDEDEGYAMFRQAAEEGEEDVDFEEKGDVEDIVDSDFDMSSDQGDDENDEEAGERALQEEERAAKKAAKAVAKTKAVHATVRRPAVPRKSALSSDQTEDRRRPKSISFVEGGEEQNARNQRASKRKSTMRVAETVQARLKEDEERRARYMEHAAPKRKKVRLSQADYIAEALEMEERNRESLKVFFEREEARKERDRKGKKTGIEGPFIRWRSVTVNRASGTQRHAVQVIDSTTGRLTSTQAITLDPVFAARDAAIKARKAREEAVEREEVAKEKRDEEEEESVAQQGPSTAHSRTTTVSEGQSENVLPTHDDDTQSVKAIAADGQEGAKEEVIRKENEVVENRATSASEHQASDKDKEVTAVVDPALNNEAEVETAGASKEDENAAKDDVATPNEGKPPADLSVPAKEEKSDDAVAQVESSVTLHTEDPSSQSVDAGSEARAYVSLHALPPSTSWSTWFGHLLGTHVDWASYPIVPARNRPLRPRQSVCPITGLPAKYRDPRSGVPFATVEAFESLTRVMRGDFRWSGKGSSSADIQSHTSAIRYDPLEMGCFFDAMNETGANGVFLQANLSSSNDVVGAASSTLHRPGQGYIPRNALAPGDEKAVIAAAHALPAGSTRSGGRRSTARG